MSYKKSTIVDYDQSILNNYSESAKLKLAKKVLLKDDYASFEKIINALEDPYVLFDHVVNKLDITAEEVFSQLVKGYNLSPTKVHFLERMADYVNRGTHV